MDGAAPELQPEVETPIDRRRMGRALALGAASVLVIAGMGIAYLHPSFGAAVRPRAFVAAAPSDYKVTRVDFVTPSTGWVVAVFGDGDFLVMRTTDAGTTWKPQLSGPTEDHGVYLRFFDQRDGMFALVGARPILFSTYDGGVTWSHQVALTSRSAVISWSFLTPAEGWMLVTDDPQTPDVSALYRTADGGRHWTDLGSPVSGPDRAYAVDFSDASAGWLVAQTAGPYAYRSRDLGTTWSRVALPPPAAAWPDGGGFLVSAQPTRPPGVVVTVVNFAAVSGRRGIGANIVAYPPLTVRAYDGGAPVRYSYEISTDALSDAGPTTSGSITAVEAPNQVVLSSLDGGASWTSITLPSAPGAIGPADAANWWWIGSGTWTATHDAGRTWAAPRTLAAAQPLPGSLHLLDLQHAWFAAAAGPRPALESTADAGSHWRHVLLPPISSRFMP